MSTIRWSQNDDNIEKVIEMDNDIVPAEKSNNFGRGNYRKK